MSNNIYTHVASFSGISVLKALSGKSAEEIVRCWQNGQAKTIEPECTSIIGESHFIQSMLSTGVAKLTSDGGFLIVDGTVSDPAYEKHGTETFIDIYKLGADSKENASRISEIKAQFRKLKKELQDTLLSVIRETMGSLGHSRIVLLPEIYESEYLDDQDRVYESVYINKIDMSVSAELESVSVNDKGIIFGFEDGECNVREDVCHWELSVEQLDYIHELLCKIVKAAGEDGDLEINVNGVVRLKDE